MVAYDKRHAFLTELTMGNEAICLVDYNGTRGEAKTLLETDELIIRTPFRLKIPFAEMKKVDADDDHLRIRWSSHSVSLSLGAEARKWARKILNPKTLAEKLGIKSGQKISIAGKLDESFVDELRKLGADIGARMRAGSDVIFFAISSRDLLDRMTGIKDSLAAGGALWVVRPKGSDAISEGEVRDAGRAAGLVDVKVARFSPTHTAEKFVIPEKDRAKHRNRG